MSALPPDHQIDAARLPVMLSTLRLPSIGRHWEGFASRADLEGWGAARYLAALCEHELADRTARRIARHLAEAGLPRGKTFATFEFAAVPTVRKAHLMALGEGDAWLDQGANILCFGPSGTGKTHAAAAIGHALVRRSRVRRGRPVRPSHVRRQRGEPGRLRLPLRGTDPHLLRI